jgi:RNA polymerase sigma-B factor
MAPTIAPPAGERLRAKDTHRLFERYQRDRDPADLEALVDRFLPLAKHLARRYTTGGAERDDLDQVASIGLLKAIDRFDPGRGLAFTSFAVPTILGELKRHFRDYGWSVRVPRELKELAAKIELTVEELVGELGRTPTTEQIARRCGVTVERVLEARATATAHRADSLDKPLFEEEEEPRIGQEDPAFERVERAADVDRLLARLPEREQQILRLRFQDDLVQREIASRVGLSQMQVSRTIAHAIDTLRSTAEEEALRRRA